MPETSVQRRDEALPDKSGVSMSSISLSLEAEICPEDVRFVRYSRQLCNIVGSVKSFPVESDEHFWVVARYVERNALRANLVLRAEEWRWSSLWQRCHPTGEERSLLAAWPIDMPANCLERVNQTDDAQELEALRRSVQRGRPFGQPEWQKEIAKRLGLESAYRPTGRPRRVGRNQNASPG